jgi:hypothetical protein
VQQCLKKMNDFGKLSVTRHALMKVASDGKRVDAILSGEERQEPTLECGLLFLVHRAWKNSAMAESVVKVDRDLPNKLPRVEYLFTVPSSPIAPQSNPSRDPQIVAEKYYEASKCSDLASRWSLLHEALRLDSSVVAAPPSASSAHAPSNAREVYLIRSSPGEYLCM